MKKKLSNLSLLLPFVLSGCSASLNDDEVRFSKENLVQSSFGGLGVEWGAYEDTEKIMEGGWERILKNMDHLHASRIRLMINYDWFCYNYDSKGTLDKNDDTWSYNFVNKYALNTCDILEYCQVNHIDVAFGAWNVIGDLSGGDIWGMMDEVTSDIRWAKISADILSYLIKDRGFTCIKWFVNSNEPNYRGTQGGSKNWNNTYEIWEQGVKNVRKAFDDAGLGEVGIVGGDTTGFEGCEEYLLSIASNIKDLVADYGAHLYLSNILVDRGEAQERIRELYDEIKKRDPELGSKRMANVWEAGLRDGKTALDCQSLIATPSYAVRMVDYTIQCLASGINGICYWNFDDAMNFMYTNAGTTAKEWGMFSSLADAGSGKQELRPWYHTSSLLCHLFQKGDRIIAPKEKEESKTFRSLAMLSKDGEEAGFVAVNAGTESIHKTFTIPEMKDGQRLYVYYFNADSYLLDGDGYLIPNQILSGNLSGGVSIEIEKSTAVFVSNRRLS